MPINVHKFERDCLEAHNRYRALHGCPPLQLNSAMSAKSREWAEYLAKRKIMEQSSGHNYGENIYMAEGIHVDGARPVKAWYDEIEDFDFDEPKFVKNAGHFTQLVWKATHDVGIGVANIDNVTVVVTNYFPPGNVHNRFTQNVPPPLNHRESELYSDDLLSIPSQFGDDANNFPQTGNFMSSTRNSRSYDRNMMQGFSHDMSPRFSAANELAPVSSAQIVLQISKDRLGTFLGTEGRQPPNIVIRNDKAIEEQRERSKQPSQKLPNSARNQSLPNKSNVNKEERPNLLYRSVSNIIIGNNEQIIPQPHATDAMEPDLNATIGRMPTDVQYTSGTTPSQVGHSTGRMPTDVQYTSGTTPNQVVHSTNQQRANAHEKSVLYRTTSNIVLENPDTVTTQPQSNTSGNKEYEIARLTITRDDSENQQGSNFALLHPVRLTLTSDGPNYQQVPYLGDVEPARLTLTGDDPNNQQRPNIAAAQLEKRENAPTLYRSVSNIIIGNRVYKTTQPSTQATDQSTTQPNVQSIAKSTAQSTAQSTTPATATLTGGDPNNQQRPNIAAVQREKRENAPTLYRSVSNIIIGNQIYKTTQPTTPTTDQSTTGQSTTQPTVQSIAKSSAQSTTQATAQLTTQSIVQSTKSSPQSTIQPTTQSTTQRTSQSTTQPIAKSTTPPKADTDTTQPNSSRSPLRRQNSLIQKDRDFLLQKDDNTTQPNTRLSTQATTQPNTRLSTQATTEPNTRLSTQATTEPNTRLSTQATTQPNTRLSTQATTQPNIPKGYYVLTQKDVELLSRHEPRMSTDYQNSTPRLSSSPRRNSIKIKLRHEDPDDDEAYRQSIIDTHQRSSKDFQVPLISKSMQRQSIQQESQKPRTSTFESNKSGNTLPQQSIKDSQEQKESPPKSTISPGTQKEANEEKRLRDLSSSKQYDAEQANALRTQATNKEREQDLAKALTTRDETAKARSPERGDLLSKAPLMDNAAQEEAKAANNRDKSPYSGYRNDAQESKSPTSRDASGTRSDIAEGRDPAEPTFKINPAKQHSTERSDMQSRNAPTSNFRDPNASLPYSRDVSRTKSPLTQEWNPEEFVHDQGRQRSPQRSDIQSRNAPISNFRDPNASLPYSRDVSRTRSPMTEEWNPEEFMRDQARQRSPERSDLQSRNEPRTRSPMTEEWNPEEFMRDQGRQRSPERSDLQSRNAPTSNLRDPNASLPYSRDVSRTRSPMTEEWNPEEYMRDQGRQRSPERSDLQSRNTPTSNLRDPNASLPYSRDVSRTRSPMTEEWNPEEYMRDQGRQRSPERSDLQSRNAPTSNLRDPNASLPYSRDVSRTRSPLTEEWNLEEFMRDQGRQRSPERSDLKSRNAPTSNFRNPNASLPNNGDVSRSPMDEGWNPEEFMRDQLGQQSPERSDLLSSTAPTGNIRRDLTVTTQQEKSLAAKYTEQSSSQGYRYRAFAQNSTLPTSRDAPTTKKTELADLDKSFDLYMQNSRDRSPQLNKRWSGIGLTSTVLGRQNDTSTSSARGVDSNFQKLHAPYSPTGEKRLRKSIDFTSVEKQFQTECLNAHNCLRARHGSPPLELCEQLSTYATKWAQELSRLNKLFYSPTEEIGENIYMSAGMRINGATPVKAWYNEIRDYDFNKAKFTPYTGHFTQVVWKDTQELGVGVAKNKKSFIVVASYYPPGNQSGKFNHNVLPRRAIKCDVNPPNDNSSNSPNYRSRNGIMGAGLLITLFAIAVCSWVVMNRPYFN